MKHLSLIVLFSVAFCVTAFAQEYECYKVPVFEANKNGYYIYRIPSLVATPKGTILAFCSARKGKGGDWDPIDIVMRRSTDSGKTWDNETLFANNGTQVTDNPEPIVDYQTGEVHMVYQIDYARFMYRKSSDEGLTWTDPVDITYVIEKFRPRYNWNVLAPGPGHAIQMSNGRLVVPLWLCNSGTHSHRPSIVVSVYSDDHGKTWEAGDIVVPDNDVTVIPNETCCIQLADGRVLFNSRNESSNYRRLETWSADGATAWSEPHFADAFFEPICQGSLCRYSLKPFQTQNRILFCNPDSRQDPWVSKKASTPRSAPGRHRTNLTMRMSYDEGLTWPVSKVLDPNIAGYSDIAVTPDGLIHVIYEGGSLTDNHFLNTQVSVLTFSLEWLTDGKDRLKRKDFPIIPYK